MPAALRACGVLQLRDRVVDARHRDHAHGEQPIAIDGAVLLGEELIPGVDDCL